MKILMVGTGVIGTLYGHALSKHNEITHFVRESKFHIVNKKTITYDIIDERENKKNMYTKGSYTYNCVTKVDCDYDLIILPVNSFQLKEALESIIEQAPNGKYLLLTLNWDGTDKIDKLLRKEQYIMGYAGGGGTFKDDLLWGNVGNDITLGTVYDEQKMLLKTTIKIFKESDIKPQIPKNMLHWLWIHNVGASPLGVGLSKYSNIDDFLKDKKLSKICFKAMLEGYYICKKRGVNIKEFPEVKMIKMPFFILYPMFKHNFKSNPIMQRYTAHAFLAIDEMKDNFKHMYRTGRDMKVDMPNMDKLSNSI